MWVIVKMVKNSLGNESPVIILNGESEILEFESREKAEQMKVLFETNSTSKNKYFVKELKTM